MNNKIILLIILVNSFFICKAQINELNHQKYWFYRKRLVNEFLVSGEDNILFEKRPKQPKPPVGEDDTRDYLAGCGLSIPMHHITYGSRKDDKKILDFSESPAILGYYIAVLASELRLLYDYGQPYENTQRELYYALKAVERMDLEAEKLIYGNDGELNGFLLRDDADYNLYDNFPYLMDTSSILTSHMITAYRSGEYEYMGNNVECVGDCNNAFLTQDQLSSLFIGYALINKCLYTLPSSVTTYNGFSFKESVFSNITRIISRIASHNWLIQFDNGKLTKFGHSMLTEFNAYGIAKATDYITNDSIYNFSIVFPYENVPSVWNIIPCVIFVNPIGILACIIELNMAINHWTDGKQVGWKMKGLYNMDVINWSVPGTGKSFGNYMFDQIMFDEKADFSASLVFDYAAIANAWYKRDLTNITSDALKFYGMRYNTEMQAILNNYLHGGLTYDETFKSKITSYINCAPCYGPHRASNSIYGKGIPGWLTPNRWSKPIKAYYPDENAYPDVDGNGLDYMLLYNLMWLEKSHISDLFSISDYTYPEYYIYPLKCLNKAYYPLNIKTYKPLSLPDEYSDELYLNSSTPYQKGTYRFEAPEITFGPNFSINGPAEFVISNDVEYDLCYEQAKTYDFTIQRTDNVCTDDFSYPGYDCISMCCPLIADNKHSDLVTYKWRFRNYSQEPVTEFVDVEYEKSFTEWDEYVVPGAYYIECAAYYNGILVRDHIESFNYNNPDICCRGPLRNADTDEKNNSEDINVMPNPVEDYIEIVNINEQATIEIYNSQGEKVYNISSNDNKVRINIADYPKGFYFVKVITSEQIKQFKVICK